jgi:hypothetical protein
VTIDERLARPLTYLALMILSALLVGACAYQLPTVPALSNGEPRQPGKIVWHDLVTPDLAAAQRFYGAMFGWTFEPVAEGYVLVRNDGRLIGGMASIDRSRPAGYWIALMSVPDVDQAVAQTTAAGGESLLPPFTLPGRGRIAVLRDPQGAVFGVVDSASGDPLDRAVDVNDWLWHEVWSEDRDAAAAFYTSLAGYSVETDQTPGGTYSYLASQGRPRLGLGEKPGTEFSNTWVSYLRVDDVQALTDRVEAHGGSVVMAPRPEVRNASVAIITDPNGAGLVLQEWDR